MITTQTEGTGSITTKRNRIEESTGTKRRALVKTSNDIMSTSLDSLTPQFEHLRPLGDFRRKALDLVTRRREIERWDDRHWRGAEGLELDATWRLNVVVTSDIYHVTTREDDMEDRRGDSL